ncbi:MAG TPA: class I SAM-dependent rRNA methyltransferase [Candidatus Polarisedimenticolaceae bacterium]|nr:class I SAM-dependent rRNA methyltransferase [Candidatus Polarisedimenticolaceae bacterium]
MTVGPRGARRLRAGHPWVFRDDVSEAAAASSGDVVAVREANGRALGFATFSRESKITLRALTLEPRAPDRRFWAETIERAVALRRRTVRDSDAWRVLFGESDGVPGLIADLYGRHLVVQCLTRAAERLLPELLEALAAHLAFDSVLARNDPAVRELEGLPRVVEQLRGTTPEELELNEGGVRYVVDPRRGQKTGAFLDQRENRLAAADYARGRVLDVFAYQGGFGLHAARRAEEVVGIDSSAVALARARRAAALSGLDNLVWVEANAFDELRRREREGERFALVTLDPPALAKSRGDLPAARRAYKELNLRAMRLVEDGGMLVTSSCSYNLGEGEFLDVLAAAAADARRTFRVVEKRTQARDHPLRLAFPESHYLKCVVLGAV